MSKAGLYKVTRGVLHQGTNVIAEGDHVHLSHEDAHLALRAGTVVPAGADDEETFPSLAEYTKEVIQRIPARYDRDKAQFEEYKALRAKRIIQEAEEKAAHDAKEAEKVKHEAHVAPKFTAADIHHPSLEAEVKAGEPSFVEDEAPPAHKTKSKAPPPHDPPATTHETPHSKTRRT
jgi:hypothetical protein